MSTSRQFSESRAIPTRTVLINDTTQLPHDYCTTPGGTLFSTTPGGKGLPRVLIFIIKKMEGNYHFVVFCTLTKPVTVHVTVAYRLLAALSSWSKQKQGLAPPLCSLATVWLAGLQRRVLMNALLLYLLQLYLKKVEMFCLPPMANINVITNSFKQIMYMSYV